MLVAAIPLVAMLSFQDHLQVRRDLMQELCGLLLFL